MFPEARTCLRLTVSTLALTGMAIVSPAFAHGAAGGRTESHQIQGAAGTSGTAREFGVDRAGGSLPVTTMYNASRIATPAVANGSTVHRVRDLRPPTSMQSDVAPASESNVSAAGTNNPQTPGVAPVPERSASLAGIHHPLTDRMAPAMVSGFKTSSASLAGIHHPLTDRMAPAMVSGFKTGSVSLAGIHRPLTQGVTPSFKKRTADPG